MMAGFRFPFLSVSPRTLRALGPVTAALALLAVLPQAWSTTFTVVNNTFPATAVGKSTTQNVTLTVNVAVPITSISIAPSFNEYSLGAIAGCTVDPEGGTVLPVGTVCTLPVTFTPAAPGTATAPPPISRSAPLLVKDVESGKPNGYGFALTGSATGSVFAFAPGYLTAFVGNASFVGGFTPGCVGQTDANGDGCPATDAFIYPSSMALDAAGNLYISDGPLNVVHKVDAVTGIISIFAGQYKKQGTGGSGGPATSIKLYNPAAVAVDQAGNVYVDDPVQGLWEINPATGIATIIAGGGQFSISTVIQDGKTADQAFIGNINTMLVDPAGNIYFGVYSVSTVYRIDAVTDLISVVAGSVTNAFPATGIPGPAVDAKFGTIQSLAMDSTGNLYLADSVNGLVYKVDKSGNISVVAGTQTPAVQYGALCTSDSGDWGPATSAAISQPFALAFDAADNLYIGEPGSQGGTSCPVRRVDKVTGLIHVVAGDITGSYAFLNNVGATETYLSPNLVAVDGGGNIYVGQQNISAGVSKILGSQSAIVFAQQSQDVTGLQLVSVGNVGIGSDLLFSNFPFPIVPIPSNATPTPFSNILLTGNDPQDCSVGTLTPGAICGIQVAYNPVSSTKVAADETLQDDSLGVAGTSNVLNIQGSAYNGPTITLAPDPVNFLAQSVGVPSAAKAVDFSIIISPNITYESTTITGPDASSFSLSSGGNTCTAGMAISGSGGTCNDYVIFNPQAGGALNATLNATFTAKGVTYTLTDPLSGTGNAPEPMAGFSPTSLAFGGQVVGTTSPAQAITLFNSGNAPLTGITPTITGANSGSYAITTGPVTCTDTLPPASTCNFWFTFSPTAAGSLPATLSVADNEPGSPQTAPLDGTGVVFSSNIGTAQANQSVTVYIATTGTLNSIQVLTQGAANLDFTMASGGTCATGTAYTVGATCTVNVVFTPQFAGTRSGAILLTDASGNALGTTYLPGTGAGPEIVYGPGTLARVPGSQSTPWGVAVDGAGNVYYNNTNFGSVLQIPWTGSAYGTAVTIATDVASDFGKSIAVDGAGNVFVGSNEPGAIVTEIPRTPTGWGTQLIVPTNVGGAFGITVDGGGSLYIADSSGQVVKLPWTGTGFGTQITLPATGLISPWGVAVDGAGNVYIADHDANIVVELPWTGSGYGTLTTVSSAGLTNLTGLAVDGTSNLYVAGGVGSTSEIVRIPWSGSAYGTPTVLPGFDYTQVAVDGAGNVYGNEGLYANSELGIFKIDLADAPSLTFAATNAGSTSLDSPQTVTVTNIGNVGLYFNAQNNNPVYPLNFPIDNNAPNLCEEDNSVQPGSSCNVSINFMPTIGGSLSGFVVLTDNNLLTNATQSISVSGNGIAATAPAVTLNPPSLNFNVPTGNTSNVATSTLTNTGTAPLTITKTSLTGANPGSFIETDNCVAISPIPINGTCTISVQFVSTVVGPFSAAVSIVDNAANTPQSLPLNATATPGAPIVTLTPALAFPVTPVGQGNQLMARLANTGNAPLTNIAVTITGANAYMFSIYPNGSCYGKTTLPQDSACTISVDFYPPGPGSFEAVLTVTDNATGSPQTSILTGEGTQPELQFTPGQFNFLAGTPGELGDTGSGPATSALISGGFGIALDSAGLVYFSDYDFNTVYQIDGSGNIDVYAGVPVEAPGHGSYSGDNGPAASATLNTPEQIAFDPSGNLYIADRFNNLIRMVNSAGTITTFAGNYGNGFGGYAGDGGPANQATLSNPEGVTADPQGNVYIADTNNNVVRKVDTTGTITLFAGTPNQYGNSGDGGPATSAKLGQIYQLATDLNGNLYIADFGNGVVRKVDSAGTITTYAGGGMAAVTPTPQPATSVNLNNGPVGLATDPAGNLYVLGLGHTNQPGVFVVTASQQISQIVGGGATLLNGAPANAEDTNLNAIAVDAHGDLYVNDEADHIVSEIDPYGDLVFPNTPVNTASAPLTVTLSNTGNAPLSFSNQNEDVVRKQRQQAPATARASAKGARPNVVDFNSYGNISGPFTIASGGTCNFDNGIAAGDSCTMNVTFNPTATGAATGIIHLYTQEGNSSNYYNAVLLSGAGTQAGNLSATLTPTLPFPNTFVGTTTSALAATLSNTGNGPLTIGSIAIGGANPSDFTIATGSNACGTTLAADATCSIYVTFTPASATALSATLTVTDNASPATQSSTLTGTGLALMPQVINFIQPNSPVTYAPGMTIPLVATGGASGNPVVFTIDASSTGTGTISGSTLTVTGVGTLVIDANQAGNASYSAAPQVQRTLVVNQAAQTISFTQPSSPVTFASGLTVPLTATGGASGSPVTFTIDASSTATGTITGSTLTVTSTGTFVIDANQAGNANFSAAPQVQRTLAVHAPIPQAIVFTQPATPVTYAPGLTVALAATGGASGDPVVFTLDAGSTGTGSISGGTLTITAVGTFVIDANQAGNSTYTAAPQVQRTVVVNKAAQAINFTQPATPVVFSSGLTIALTATGGASGSAVVFTLDESSTATGSISGGTLTVTSAGNLVIDANQGGNTDYSAAPQVQRTVLVNPPPPDFTLTAAPSSQTVAPGGSTTFTVTVGAINGTFSNVVTLSASGLPTGANGAFAPATINPGNSNGTSTLTVQLAPALQASAHGSSWPLATPALALLFLLPFRRWRKAWRGKLLLLVAGLVSLASIVNLTGCGGGFLLGGLSQTYTITITGASGNDTHSTTVQLTVK
jgi:sugar lactone lactonase YvrE